MTAGALHESHARIGARRAAALAAAGCTLLLSLALDLTAGPADLGVADLMRGLLDPEDLPLRDRIILWDVRLPDALIAVVVGAALGLAGVETQTALDNPLASPFTLGVSAAATLGASLAIVLAPAWLPPTLALPAASLTLALASGAAILLFASWFDGAREAVVLFGIALLFLCNALTSLVQYVASAEAVQQIVFWTVGNLTRAGWTEVGVVALCLLAVAPFSLGRVSAMTVLRGGEAQAAALGLDVARIRRMAILRASALAAFAVCFVGAIGFVGLVGPHIARLTLGEDHRFLVPGSALCGALILSLASFLSKALIPGVVIPVGILTSVVGVPVFLALIAARRSRGWSMA